MARRTPPQRRASRYRSRARSLQSRAPSPAERRRSSRRRCARRRGNGSHRRKLATWGRMLLFRAVPEKSAMHRALLLMTTSAFFFGLMAFSAKLASARLSGPQVAMIRFAVGILPCLVVPRYRRDAMTFHRVDLLLYRGLFGGIAVLLYFIAI